MLDVDVAVVIIVAVPLLIYWVQPAPSSPESLFLKDERGLAHGCFWRLGPGSMEVTFMLVAIIELLW